MNRPDRLRVWATIDSERLAMFRESPSRQIKIDSRVFASPHEGTWSGPTGKLKLAFTDGHEELHDVQNVEGGYLFPVEHTGTLQDVWFSTDGELWHGVG